MLSHNERVDDWMQQQIGELDKKQHRLQEQTLTLQYNIEQPLAGQESFDDE